MPETTFQGRKKFMDDLVKWDINANLNYPLDTDNEENWEDAFWPMELILYRSTFVKAKLQEALAAISQRTTYFQRSLLEELYTNYPDSFQSQVLGLMEQTHDPEIFALCAEYLWRNGEHSGYRPLILNVLNVKNNLDTDQRILPLLRRRLAGDDSDRILPPLIDLLDEKFAPGLPVFYSFQSQNRDYPGWVIVRKTDGSFVRDSLGHLFMVPQLARSISNLPYYLTNGNTPQGVFKTNGFGASVNEFIGPTENIQMTLPFESRVNQFFPDNHFKDSSWSLEKYLSILPESWRDYFPVQETYFAGQAGRTQIIAHGTTIDPQYYKTKIYYPETPSLGCLCAAEKWSGLDGSRMESDQQKLIDAMKLAGNGQGYAVVINLADQIGPQQIQEIRDAVSHTEVLDSTFSRHF
ncbi:MAG: hypothetical protein ACYCOO_03915 [Chitinophagaceae bacterium]